MKKGENMDIRNEWWYKIDGDVKEIIETLERYENTIFEDREEVSKKLQKGETIIKELTEGEIIRTEGEIIRRERYYLPATFGAGSFNIIPGGVPGSCRKVLVVVIGSKDSVKMRVLEAIAHLAVKCPDITKYVIFWTVKMNTSIFKHIFLFKKLNVTVIWKQFYMSPTKVV